jgi:hypothetical protein
VGTTAFLLVGCSVLNIEVKSLSETSINLYQSTLRHISEDRQTVLVIVAAVRTSDLITLSSFCIIPIHFAPSPWNMTSVFFVPQTMRIRIASKNSTEKLHITLTAVASLHIGNSVEKNSYLSMFLLGVQ